MILPITFRNVPYRVAGSSKYKGDLILTSEIIYYFPHTDVANKWFTIIGTTFFVTVGVLALPAILLFAFVFGGPSLLNEIIKSWMQEGVIKGVKGTWKIIKEGRSYISKQHDETQQSVNSTSPLIALYPVILYPELWYPLILDSIILDMKDHYTFSRDSIPTPIRFSRNQIHRLSLSFTGMLIIETEFDMRHKFYIGILMKGRLRKGLKESGFIS